MSDSNYKNIYTGNIFIAQRIQHSLEEIGINVVIKDDNESGRLAGFGTISPAIQEVFVHENEYEKAISVVESILSE